MAYAQRIVFIACSFILIRFCISTEKLNFNTEKNIVSTFHEQLLKAKVNLTKTLVEIGKTKRETSPLNVKWNHQWAESIENSNSALMQYVGNNIFILSKDTVYNLNEEILSTFKLIPILSLQDMSGQVRFIESIEWENILFLLLGLNNGQCRLMTATSKLDFSIRQTISNLENPVDAEFFVLNNQLFVIIIFNQVDDTKVATRIYRWRNTLLDEEPLNHIRTIGAISVTTFTYKQSAMLIIGQMNRDKQQVSSQVFKMKSNGVIEKIQFLPTRDPVSIKHFKIGNDNFIMVLEKNQPSTIYWWEGKEFVEWLSLPKIFGDFTLSVGYARGNTLILLYKQNIVAVYSMSWQELHKVMMMGFSGDVVNAALYDHDKLYLVVVTKTETMKIEMVQLIIETKDTSTETNPKRPMEKSDQVGQCVKNLEDSLNIVEDKLRLLQKILPNLLYDNKPEFIKGSIKLLGATSSVTIETGKIEEVQLQNNYITLKSQSVDEKIVEIEDRINNVSKKVLQAKNSTNMKTIIFEKDLVIREAKINSIRTAMVNNVFFSPDELISLTGFQRLKANIMAPQVNTEWLVTNFINSKATKNLVPENNTFKSPQIFSSLYCNSIENKLLPLINGINITNLATSKMNVTLMGETIVGDLFVEDLKVGLINQEQSLESLLDVSRTRSIENLRLLDNTYIQNININEVNGINIDKLMNSLVLQRQNNTINGNLYFRNGFQSKEFVVNKIHVQSPKSSTKPYFKDHRKKRDLSPSNSKRRIVIYTGNVKVEGSMQANKLSFINSVLHVKNHSTPIVMTKIDHMFWNKQSNQIITVPMIFGNGALLQGDLDIKKISGYDLTAYSNTDNMFSHISMKQNVSVNQFVRSGKSRDFKTLDFKRLNSSIVRKEGLHYINGKMVFTNKLHINHLQADLINGVTPFQAFIFKGTTNWDKLVVSNLSVKGDINTNLVNKINVSEEFHSLVLSHKNYNLKSVQFSNITGNTIDLQRFNDMNIRKLLEMFKLSDGQLALRVHFNGSIRVPAILSTQSINGKNLADLLPLVVNGSNPSVIRGKKVFKSQVTVENGVTMPTLNSEVLQKVFDTRLYKSKRQNISGFYSIQKCKLGTLATDVIDGLNFNNLVFINDPIITIKSDIVVEDLTVRNSSTAVKLMEGCVLPKVERSLIFANELNWSSLHVDNDVQWKSKVSNGIHKLIDFAMLKDKTQIISGNVIFNSPFKAENLEAAFINNLNISFILDDAVTKNKFNQIVSGHKVFKKKIWCSHCKVFKEAKIPVINEINITELNDKLIMYNTDSVITGHKTFKNGFKSVNFTCKDGVNDIKAKDIVTETTNSLQPYAVFSSLEVIEDLTVGSINTLNLTEFIQNIVTVKSDHPQTVRGQVIFKKSVQLSGESTIKSINSINVEETLSTYDFQKNPQNVYVCTNITSPVILKGNLKVDRINGKSLSEIYKTAMLDNGNYTIHGAVVFDKEQYVHMIYGNKYFSEGLQLSFLNQSVVGNSRKTEDFNWLH